MKVAIVFNEPYAEILDPYAISCPPDFINSDVFKLRGTDIIAEYEQLAISLRNKGYDCYILNILDNLDILIKDIEKNNPDVIFNLIEIYKDKAGLEKNFAAFFELAGIHFTGATTKSLGLCQNKYLSKQILSANGIKVPNYRLIKTLSNYYEVKLAYPLIVKPVAEDGSIGIDNDSVVDCYDKLADKINNVIKKHKQPVIIEEYIEGREFNVGLIEDDGLINLPISEIDFSNLPPNYHKIVDFNAKWNYKHECYQKTVPICPAKIDKELEERLYEIARKCFNVLEINGYARVDIRVDKNNEIYVLEVNPNPDLSIDAGFFRAAKAKGYTYGDLLETIVKNAINRTKTLKR